MLLGLTIRDVVLIDSNADLIGCYEAGANAYVVKPVNFSAFMEAVKSLGIFWAAVNEPLSMRV